MDDLAGRVVLVSGGSRGIGRAIVLGAVARGAKVAFCARSLGEDARKVCAEAEGIGGPGTVLAVAADVSRAGDVDALFDRTLAEYGRLDAVVNNAGINIDGLLAHLSTDDLDAVLATNLTGPFLMCRRAVRELLAAGGGTVVNIGSIFEHGATSQSAYATSKGGLHGLTRAVADAYGSAGVTANLVVSGFVETDLSRHMPQRYRDAVLDNPLRRFCEPDEVASVVLFLAGPGGRALNGEVVHASGGLVEANIVG
jgi:3-oxoacyl-[acyl-carrier protein] reductase